jgi:hypothetical protein
MSDVDRFEAFPFRHGLVADALDDGPLLTPKIFRRQTAWAWARDTQAFTGTFLEYLAAHPIRCFATKDFLASGPKAKERDVASLIASGEIDVFDPTELVFRESSARVVRDA